MIEFKAPRMTITYFDSHIVTDLSDIGANAQGVDEITWALLESKFNDRAVELTDIIKYNKAG